MRLLLDTHVALWIITDDARLKPQARTLVLGAEVFISAVSLWEIAMEHALRREGPNAMPVSAAEANAWFAESGFQDLPITAAHAVAVERLPPLHADPFDRLLIAQAMTEPMRLLRHDTTLARYTELVEVV